VGVARSSNAVISTGSSFIEEDNLIVLTVISVVTSEFFLELLRRFQKNEMMYGFIFLLVYCLFS